LLPIIRGIQIGRLPCKVWDGSQKSEVGSRKWARCSTL